MPYDPELDRYIKQQVDVGYVYEEHVGNCLIDAGIPAEFKYEGHHRWRPETGTVMTGKQKDIVLPGGFVVEVKSIRYRFTCKDDFPFDPVMVDTAYGYDAKQFEPLAYVNVCQKTMVKVAFWVAETKPLWTKERKMDNQRGYESTWYFTPRDTLVSWEDFVARLYDLVWIDYARRSFTQEPGP